MCVQVLCALLSQRRMFHLDELVQNYLQQASQRYSELREQQHRQSDELERLLSPAPRTSDPQGPSTSGPAQISATLPAFERKNTLLLTGKSKFYTMTYEDHCLTPTKPDDIHSGVSGQYRTLLTDKLDIRAKLFGVKTSRNVHKSKSQCGALTSSDEASSLADKWPCPDTNHNSIFWPSATQCLGTVNCPHPVLPHSGGLCAGCLHARRYSTVVHYPTAMTKL